MLFFALIARQLWKHFRLPKQRPHWCDSARRRWWYLYLARCGAILGPWTCWDTRKWNRRQARKRRFSSKVCWNWAFLGGLKAGHKKKDKMLDEKLVSGIVAWSL